jgi:hypothetical protein
MSCDQTQQVFFGVEVRSFIALSGEIQIVPAYDAVFDEAISAIARQFETSRQTIMRVRDQP